VLNAHLTADTDGDWSTTNRFFPVHRAQLRKLLALTREPELEDQNLLLSGDFNLAKESELYDEFRVQGGWIDPLKDDDSPTFHQEFLPPGAHPHRIDYIFARARTGSQCTVKRAATLLTERVPVRNRHESSIFLSDHAALQAQLSFSRATAH
jgi:endonuclease/exonuclease/phosphatase family metal-dependent hydrolase